MNVLFVIHTGKDINTSVYRLTQERAETLRFLGHDVSLITANDCGWALKFGGRFTPLIFPFFIAIQVWRWSPPPDVVIFHSYSGWVLNAIKRFRKRAPRTITQFHGLEPLYRERQQQQLARTGQSLSLRYRLVHGVLKDWMLASTCRNSDLVICLNNQERAFLTENKWAEPRKVHIVPNSFSDSFLVERHYRPEAKRLIYVGQWLAMKGIHYLVETFSALASSHPSLELLCVGTLIQEDGVLRDFPENFRRRVLVRPRVEPPEIVAALLSADIFVFPTLSEGFSVALVEAMATGIPIVTTPVGAASDVLEDGMSATFVPAQDGSALTYAVAKLLASPELRETLGRGARAAAKSYRKANVDEQFVTCVQQQLGAAQNG